MPSRPPWLAPAVWVAVTSHALVTQLKPEKAAASQAAGDFALNWASQLLFVMIKATKV